MNKPSDKSIGITEKAMRKIEPAIDSEGTSQGAEAHARHAAGGGKAETNKEAEAAVDRENRIRERAYWIWLREGLPDGRQHHHWRQAENEVDAEDTARSN
jgi:hypothetical protein